MWTTCGRFLFFLVGTILRIPESPMNTGFLREGIFYLENDSPVPKTFIRFFEVRIAGAGNLDKKDNGVIILNLR